MDGPSGRRHHRSAEPPNNLVSPESASRSTRPFRRASWTSVRLDTVNADMKLTRCRLVGYEGRSDASGIAIICVLHAQEPDERRRLQVRKMRRSIRRAPPDRREREPVGRPPDACGRSL